ncbi:Clp protease [Neorhizobium galegae]|uniref:Clp protease n=1 Tax=Neorhizobium galegae TaxID=399 RepID=A0A6A1TSW8_NEOGA|nr:Clp protease [Neorhizobium galegae]KAB1087336.1 Clp protease [Neorhizobium galegae]
MTLDLTAVAAVVGLLLGFINLFTAVRTMLSAGEKKLDERVTKAETKLIDHDRRIQAIESDMKHLPDRETTHRIEMTMSEIMRRLEVQDATLSGRFEAMDERLKPIQAIGERLQDALIEQARNAA